MKFDSSVSKMQESVLTRGLELSESRRWRGYSNAIREGYQEKNGKSIADNIVSTTAILLENTYNYCNRMDETTRVVNLGNFVDYGFEVISAVVPNLIAHDLVSVQPLNAKFGAIFYLQYLYGNNKGTIAKGGVMNSPFTGFNGSTNFTNEVVEGEALGSGNGTKKEFKTTLAYTPVRLETLKVNVGTDFVIDIPNGDTTVEGEVYSVLKDTTGANTVAVNTETGKIIVSLQNAPAENVVLTANYDYDMDLTNVGFSQVDLDLKSVSIEAKPRKIRARWLLDAAFELQKTKGIDAESELVIALSSEIKHEIDNELLTQLYVGARNAGYEWDCQLPAASGISYVDYKRTLIDVLTQMSNDIFQKTKRVGANFVVGGTNFCTVVETLPEFVPASLAGGQINGPHFIGTLNGKWRIYKNPFYNPDTFLLGYKGSSYLDAGYVYAPYMPLYATPTQVMDDFIFRKGLATSYGTLMLNGDLYAKGSIKNFTKTRMINASPIVVANS